MVATLSPFGGDEAHAALSFTALYGQIWHVVERLARSGQRLRSSARRVARRQVQHDERPERSGFFHPLSPRDVARSDLIRVYGPHGEFSNSIGRRSAQGVSAR